MTRKSTGTTQTWQGEIPDDEWALFLEFVAEAERLARTRLLREGCNAGFTIKGDQSGLRISSTLPGEDDLSALLHRIRPFILQKERLFYNAINGRLWRRIESAEFRTLLDRQHRLFNGKDFQQQLKISSDAAESVQKIFNDDATLDEWLNLYEYHRDDGSKKDRPTQISTMVRIEDLQGIFVSMMLDKAKAIQALAWIMRGFRERDGLPRIAPVSTV